MSQHVYPDLERWGQVLASSEYRWGYQHLSALFRQTRAAGRDPQALYDVQANACARLFSFQKLRELATQANNPVQLACANRLILLLKQIMDSVAWRVLGFDRVAVQLLAEHQQTGHLDETVLDDFQKARELVDQEGAIVLVNDLTHVLRHGDLTIIKGDQFEVMENKSGKASSQNRRATRQRRQLDDLHLFLQFGVRTTPEGNEYIIKVPGPVRTYHPTLAEAIRQAKKNPDRSQQTLLSDCLAVDVWWIQDQGPSTLEDPFPDVALSVTFSNLHILDKPTVGLAPYGIFPFDEEACFGLITRHLVVRTYLNLESLGARYRQQGLSLELAHPNEEERKRYLSAPIAERKQMNSDYGFIVRDEFGARHFPIDHFSPLALEFWQEGTLIEADRQLLQLDRSLHLSSENTGFYVGFKDEKNIWR